MFEFLELEETVGRAWHRLIGDTGTWLRFPDQAVKLEDMQAVLAICFRGFGGEHAVQIAPARARTSSHRLRLRQRMGLGEEKLAQPGRDHATLMLPPMLDLFPDRCLNRDLYLWLAAAMAMMPLKPVVAADPLRNVGVALQEVLGETIGLRVNPVSVAGGDFLSGLPAGRFPTYSLTWVADFPDPSAFLQVLFGSSSPDNYSGYRSATFDTMVADALAAQDEESRFAAFAAAQQVLIDDAAIIPIAFDIGYTAYRTGISGVPVSPIGLVGLEAVVGP